MSSHDSSPAIDSLLQLACAAAAAGGEVARAAFGRQQAAEFKSDGSEVTEYDRAAERAIWDTIRAARPNDAFLGEEGVVTADGASMPPAGHNPVGRVHWVVDPIDGTRNFVRGVPLFACSVAAMIDGEPVVGVVHDPIRPQTWWAGRRLGAFRDGARLPQLTPPPPSRQMVVAIPSAWRADDRVLTEHALRRHVVRSLGAASLHLAQVAAGQTDASILNNTKLWDIAAGCVLVREVGGVMTTLTGSSLFPLSAQECGGRELPNLAGTPAALERLINGAGS